MNEPLEELLGRCRTGDADAVKALVQRFRPWALDLAAALLDDGGLAEDAVQEAFIAALQRLGDLREPRAFPHWFRQIIRTHALRIVRRRREWVPVSPETAACPGAAPDETLAREELRQTVRDALRTLPSPGRETAELFYLEECSCNEVAERLQVPTGTVKRRLHDARIRMRGMLIGHIGEESEGEPGLPL